MIVHIYVFFCLDEIGEPNREPVIPFPREVATEHIQVKKCSIDASDMCEPCCIAYCRENDLQRYQRVFIHDVMNLQDAAAKYENEKCERCQIGLMGIFGWRNCPACRCEQCRALPMGVGRCVTCMRTQLTYCLTIRDCRV